MKRYLSITLCCLGAAACSHQNATEEPQTADQVATTSPSAPPVSADTATSSDGELRPASSDGVAATPSGDATAHTATTDNYHHTTAPAPGATSSKAAASSAGATTTSADRTSADKTTADKTKAAPDNTKVNERDTKSSAVTPLDQGEGQSDLDITQRIRQAVMADKSLSFTAKNVKIITRDGKVVLRGPVNSAAERTSVEAAAQRVAGGSNVESQLEVKQ